MNKVIELLNTYPKIKITEAYTGNHIGYVWPPWRPADPDRIAEVRFRANEMPEAYYETPASLAVAPIPVVATIAIAEPADEPELGDESCDLCHTDDVRIHRVTGAGLLVCGRTACQHRADLLDTP